MAHGKVTDMSTDYSHEINQSAKGKRPNFLTNQSQEHLLSMTMALLQELAVTRERVDTLERVLEANNIVSIEDLDGYRPGEEAAAERQAKQHQLISTVMRSLEQEIQTMKRQPTREAEQLHIVSSTDRVA